MSSATENGKLLVETDTAGTASNRQGPPQETGGTSRGSGQTVTGVCRSRRGAALVRRSPSS